MSIRDEKPGSAGVYYLGSPDSGQYVPVVTSGPDGGRPLQRGGSPAPEAALTLTGVRVRGLDRRAAAADGISLRIPASQSVALYDQADGAAIEVLDVVAGRRRLCYGQVAVHGTVHRMGVPVIRRHPWDRWQQSGRLPLFPSRTVTGTMLATLRSRRPDAAARARIAELLVITGAANLASRRVDTLSAEQQWRVLIARALLIDPQLVAVEDPAPGLASRAASRSLDLLMDAQARFGFALLLATSRLATAARCERVVSLVDGRVTGDELIGDDAWTRGRIDRIG